MEGFWRFVEAEGLDAAKAPEGARLSRAVVILEVEHPDAEGYKVIVISRHHSGRALRPHELSGLLFERLADL